MPSIRLSVAMLSHVDHHDKMTALLALAAKTATDVCGAAEVVEAGCIEAIAGLLHLDRSVICTSADDHRCNETQVH